ncbi:MAG: DUF805 domain-containing protein [Alphaproteobacteria bacterium]|nr:DUF805 domain-containing protein [Alphaproteobacteria bacterium]
MDPIQLLFSFQGRIGRAQYWLAVLIYFIAAAIVFVIDYFVPSYTAMIVVALLLYVPCLISSIGVGIKRLHDRNKSSWWLLLFYLGPLLAFSAASLLDGGTVASALSIAGFVILIWSIVELGALRGSIEANPYGPDPVAPKPAQH